MTIKIPFYVFLSSKTKTIVIPDLDKRVRSPSVNEGPQRSPALLDSQATDTAKHFTQRKEIKNHVSQPAVY